MEEKERQETWKQVSWDYPDPRCIYAPPMKNNLGYD